MPTVPGIDVSYWQSGIDWPKVRAAGMRFVFIRAGDGERYTDPTFAINWSGAGNAGLLRGAYHFFRPSQHAERQANTFLKVLQSASATLELPAVLDLEVPEGQSTDRIVGRAKSWLDAVESALGRKPIIYSNLSFLRTYFVVAGGPPAWVNDYPLWIAWYPNNYVEGMSPPLPPGWFRWTFWQYSQTGRVNGINTAVDLNLFNGTLEELYRFANAQMPAAPKSIEHTIAPGETFETIANKYGVTVRELVMANPQLLKVGEKLNVPTPIAIPQESTSPGPTTYIVQPGDTLTAIAIKFNTTIAALVAANGLSDPNRIEVGQQLIIP